MIIKKVQIEFFAGIKNKTLNFKEGFNLIFGENEKGKSTIENFIKIWLYGMENSRGKFNDRKKYLPLSGEKISGELSVEHEGKGYIIKRTFGRSKKDDTCEILDEITGEIIDLEYKNEPGRYFFNINLATFVKTLFISQLGVMVSKDKEEEIMEKITNIYNSGDEDTSVKKVIEKLEKRKKQLVSSRKGGEIDLLKEKRIFLKQELWEGYKLGEENLENEEKLLRRKENKVQIKDQIQKLDLYKKYIKKIKLQKDYKEISEYLLKGEELKKRQEVISGELKKGHEFVTSELLDEINDKSARYLSLLDVKQEKLNKLFYLEKDLQDKNEMMSQYSAFISMGDDIKQKIYTLKLDQKNLEGRLNEIVSIQHSIEEMKSDVNKQGSLIKNLEFISKYRNDMEALLNSYKEGLKELKYKMETQGDNKSEIALNYTKNKVSAIYFLGILSVLIFVYSIVKQVIPMMIILVPVFILLIKFYLKYSLNIKNYEFIKNNNKIIDELKDKVSSDEEKLNFYLRETDSNNYEEFISNLNKYDNYKSYKASMSLVVEKRVQEIKKYNITELKSNYNRNKGVIASLFSVLSCDSLDEVLEKVGVYEKLREDLLRIEYEFNAAKEEIKSINEQLIDKEEEIRKKISILGLEDVEIVDLHIKLREYKEKINSMKEIKNALDNVEETYKVLLKDRNIDEIREEMKEIINQDIDYSYESEEEIDIEIRRQSDELLKVEKEIKDLEYLIEKRYLGKRDISSIEEDLLINEERIYKREKEFNALELASSMLQQSFDEIRKNIGPALNSKVVDKFNFLSNRNYEEAKISEDYKLKVRENGILFDGEILSNGAKDQLYLSLRLSFIDMLFKNKEVPIFLDDAFVQYDDERRKHALDLLIKQDFSQTIFFTCQGIEKLILDKNKDKYNFISL